MDDLIEQMATAMREAEHPFAPYEALARAALGALKAHPRYALVELPELMVDRGNVAESIRDRPMWECGDAWTSLTDNQGEIEFEADRQYAYGSVSRPVGARYLAAALLAAANAAEAVSDE